MLSVFWSPPEPPPELPQAASVKAASAETTPTMGQRRFICDLPFRQCACCAMLSDASAIGDHWSRPVRAFVRTSSVTTGQRPPPQSSYPLREPEPPPTPHPERPDPPPARPRSLRTHPAGRPA